MAKLAKEDKHVNSIVSKMQFWATGQLRCLQLCLILESSGTTPESEDESGEEEVDGKSGQF